MSGLGRHQQHHLGARERRQLVGLRGRARRTWREASRATGAVDKKSVQDNRLVGGQLTRLIDLSPICAQIFALRMQLLMCAAG